MASIFCDIVILPEPKLYQKAISASQLLQQFGTLYTLRDGSCYPHASLYMILLKLDDLERVKVILADIAASTSVLNMTATGYHQSHRYIDADYHKSHDSLSLQSQVVAAINPIRDGMREKDQARILTTTGLERKSIQKYGYRGVGEMFNPHISFTRFRDEQPTAQDVLPSFGEFSGRYTKLGLFEVGDHGTCVRKIAEFKLGQDLSKEVS